jgi:hypothetical protein
MTCKATAHPLDPIHTEIDAAEHRMIQILARSFEAMKRARNAKRQRDAELHLDQPSVTELLTIEQYGYLRSYNLNDGLGADIAC